MELNCNQSSKLKQEIELIPECKAEIHGAPVTVPEVGNIKREKANHGDVINTAARIQAKCNELKKNLLVFSEIMKGLPGIPYQVLHVGKVALRGKKQPVDIHAIDNTSVLIRE